MQRWIARAAAEEVSECKSVPTVDCSLRKWHGVV